MENFSKRTLLDRLKAELQARGISLRQLDAMLPEGKRQIFQPGKDRPLDLDDILTILRVAGIEPTVFFGQVAGYGHPLEISALRGKRAEAAWTKHERHTLWALQLSEARGGQGFEAFRARLREIEQLREENTPAAYEQAWMALQSEKSPGALVSLLSMLARGRPRAQAYHLLGIAGNLLGGQLRSAAGVKYSTAAGACFVNAGLTGEGLSILENFALPLAARFGTRDDQAGVLMYIAKAEALLGSIESAKQALWKAVEVGGEQISFGAVQRLAFHELNLGDFRRAAEMYDDLIQLPFFQRAPKLAKASIACSRFTAHFAAGNLNEESVEEFRITIRESRAVLGPADQIAAVMDFTLFLVTLGRTEEARRTLEAELWQVLELEDSAIHKKFIELWEVVGLPRDNKYQALAAWAKESVGKLGSATRDPAHSNFIGGQRTWHRVQAE